MDPNILKPGMIAPGENILAGWIDTIGPTELDSDTRRTEFNIHSATSMACPHVSGVADLLMEYTRSECSPLELRLLPAAARAWVSTSGGLVPFSLVGGFVIFFIFYFLRTMGL